MTFVELVEEYPVLEPIVPSLEQAFLALCQCFEKGGKVLVCGNGGSAADADHFVGELMKGFRLSRPIPLKMQDHFQKILGENGITLARKLQGALPVISLTGPSTLITAIGNDGTFDTVFAQQVYGLGRQGDVLVCFSTSGNSMNVIYAASTARVLNLKVVSFTGAGGGRLSKLSDVLVPMPSECTYRIQELTEATYHALCLSLEGKFFATPE